MGRPRFDGHGGLLRQVVAENNTQDTLIAYRFGGIKEERQ